jgi:peptidoglycan/xylan/chitin deacetylase (PgdA/CDA1 family)
MSATSTESFKEAVKGATSAAWPLVSRVLGPVTVVLAYHRIGDPGDPYPHVTASVFRQQMAWIRAHCDPIGPADLVAAVSNRRTRRPRVLVTFDDGYRDYFERAYPILEEFEIPAVNFLPTRFIDEGGIFWWDALNLAGRDTRRSAMTLPWSGEMISLDAAGRRRMVRAVKDHIKRIDDQAKDMVLADVLDRLGLDVETLSAERHVMTWDHVRATMPLTTYGGHSHTHPLASRIEPERLEDEVRICRDRIEQETGVRPTTFAYPDGDVIEAAKQILTRHGFTLAFSIYEGVVTRDADWLEVRRYPGPPTVGGLAWRLARVSPWRGQAA